MPIDLATLLPSGRTALLLSEVQRSVIGDKARLAAMAAAAHDAGVIPNSARLADAARKHGCPVVHCLASLDPQRFGRNTNARLFQAAAARGASGEAPPYDPAYDVPCPEVWNEDDVISMRHHGLNPMADSQLDHRLRNAGITTVVIAGVSLNIAILNLAMEAVNHCYQVIVAKDAVAGFPSSYAEPVMANTLAPIAMLATTEQIVAAWATA
jgi:nicotinamidase-related amidase